MRKILCTHYFSSNLLSHFLEPGKLCFWEVLVTVSACGCQAAAAAPSPCSCHCTAAAQACTAVKQLQSFCKLRLDCLMADNCTLLCCSCMIDPCRHFSPLQLAAMQYRPEESQQLFAVITAQPSARDALRNCWKSD